MNAVPLTDPQGTIRGWMCGTCLHPGGHSERLIGLFDERMIESARCDAEACCRCWECKRAIGIDEGRGRTCVECAKVERGPHESMLIEGPFCVHCLGSGETTCTACVGSGREPITSPTADGAS